MLKTFKIRLLIDLIFTLKTSLLRNTMNHLGLSYFINYKIIDPFKIRNFHPEMNFIFRPRLLRILENFCSNMPFWMKILFLILDWCLSNTKIILFKRQTHLIATFLNLTPPQYFFFQYVCYNINMSHHLSIIIKIFYIIVFHYFK